MEATVAGGDLGHRPPYSTICSDRNWSLGTIYLQFLILVMKITVNTEIPLSSDAKPINEFL